MAIMSSRKQAVKARWEAINKLREEADKPLKDKEEVKISEEEHQRRLDVLRNIGMLK